MLLVVCLAQVESTADIVNAERLIFPGVGAFGQAMEILQQRGYTQALKEYIQVGGGGWGGVNTWRQVSGLSAVARSGDRHSTFCGPSLLLSCHAPCADG